MRLSHFTRGDRSVCLGVESLCGIAVITCKSEVWNVMPCRTGAPLWQHGGSAVCRKSHYYQLADINNFYCIQKFLHTHGIHTATIRPGLVQHIMPHFLSFCHDSSSVTSTTVSLTATKLIRLIFQLSKFHKPLFFNSGQTGKILKWERKPTRCNS